MKSSTFEDLRKAFLEGKSPDCLYLCPGDRILGEDLTEAVYKGFAEEGQNRSDTFPHFSGDDLNLESLMNECMGGGLFSTRKVVVLKNIRKLTKAKKTALTEYFADPNPDIRFIIVADDAESAEKTVLIETGNPGVLSSAKKNLKEVSVNPLTDEEMTGWIRERFEGYEISDATISHMLSLSNSELSEILPEIEKLKTFCNFSRKVTEEDVNLCNGISRNFGEGDFLKAVVSKDTGSAVRIYSSISLKRDIEIYLIVLLNAAFTAIRKLTDPEARSLQGFSLKRELKLWGPAHEMMLPLYKSFSGSTSREGIDKAIGLICSADKKLKSSQAERSVIMTGLIHGLCSLK